MADLKEHLQDRGVEFSELPNGDVFFRRSDGQGMFVRTYHDDGTYDWCVNAGRNDTNLMDYRARERHTLEDVLRRIDDFLALVVWGDVVIDTLGIVRRSMDQGMTRENAEKVAQAARNFTLAMHEAGMDASEIRSRFAEIQEQLRRGQIGEGKQDESATSGDAQ